MQREAAAAAGHPAAGSRLPVLLLLQLLPWLPAGTLPGSTVGPLVPAAQSVALEGWVLVAPPQPCLLLLQSCCLGHCLLLHLSLQPLLCLWSLAAAACFAGQQSRLLGTLSPSLGCS
jgi:hypothetical protein